MRLPEAAIINDKKTMQKPLHLLFTLGALCLLLRPATAQEIDSTERVVCGEDTIVVRNVGNHMVVTDASAYGKAGRGIEADTYAGRIPKRWKWYGGHWSGVGIYYNGLVRNLGNLSLPDGADYLRQSPKSIGVNVNLIDLTIVSNRHFGLITGLGFEINNFRFDRDIALTLDENGHTAPDYRYDRPGVDFKKSKLTTMYLNLPLLAEFQFGRGKAGKRAPGFINFGVVGGVRLQGHTKVKYRDEAGHTHTEKQHSGLNLRNFHYGVECNVGYRWVAVSARYYPQSIFVDGKGPNVQQVNIGLSFLL